MSDPHSAAGRPPGPRRVFASRRACLLGLAASLAARPGAAQPEGFEGATITIIAGFPPGGGVDAGARLIARHLPRFLPGAPHVVVQNMPGAGGVTAADHLFLRAPKDGLTLGMPGRDWPLVPLLDRRGGSYDPLAFEYIGSTGRVNTYFWLDARLGLRTPEDLRASPRPIVFGGLTPDTQPSMMPKVFAQEGYPIRVISGYRGTVEIIAAMERGEVDAVATNEASFARRPDVAASRTVRILQLLPSALPLPLASDLVSERGRRLLLLTGYASATGMPLVAPPQSPPGRVAALRQAFQRMAQDSAFASDAEKVGEPYGEPVEGERIREILRQTIAGAGPESLAAFRKLAADRG